MRRPRVLERLVLTATLQAETALHIGAADSDDLDADLDIVRDGSGRPVVPGTTLAGVLRERLYSECAGDSELLAAWQGAFGTRATDPHDPLHAPDAAASRLTVSDAPFAGDADEARIERRDHVAIDRFSATAVDRLKYDRVVLASGSSFTARFVLERHSLEEEADVKLLFLLARQLDDGITLGARATAGLGRIRATETRITRERRDSREAVLAALADRLAWREGEPVTPPELPDAIRGDVEIRIEWRPDRSMLVREGAEGLYLDTLPLTTSVADGVRTFVLPGSSIKGALRFAAERIVRTVLGEDPPTVSGAADDHIKQLALPVVDWLFGAAKGPDGSGRRGALEVPDVHAKARMTEADWEQALGPVEPGQHRRTIHDASDGEGRITASVTTHVALDRWTQGASDHRLFDVLEPAGVDWQPIVLHVRSDSLTEAERLAVGMLLRRVIDELRHGDLPLGGLVTRGHGAIAEVKIAETDGADRLGLDDELGFRDPQRSLQCFREALGR